MASPWFLSPNGYGCDPDATILSFTPLFYFPLDHLGILYHSGLKYCCGSLPRIHWRIYHWARGCEMLVLYNVCMVAPPLIPLGKKYAHAYVTETKKQR